MNRILVLKLDNGDRQFATRDLDFFNLVCELEGSGVDVMALTGGNLEGAKLFTTLRSLLAVLINVKPMEAGNLMSQHLRNGGTLDDIMAAFTSAMEDAGFGGAPTEETQEEPQEETPKAKRGRKTVK